MYRDMDPELSAWESRLDRFIRLDKGDFIGKQALVAEKEPGIKQRSVTLFVDTDSASTLTSEGVYHNGGAGRPHHIRWLFLYVPS